MSLFTEEQMARLLSNGHDDNRDQDHAPVRKLVLPGTGCVWLLSEIDPDNPDIAFGLCDLGMGMPELGSVSLSEIASICYWEGMPVAADNSFVPAYPMSVYAYAARVEQGITDDHFALASAAEKLRQSAHRHDRPTPSF